MNALHRCPNTADCVPLYLPQQLYLRPIARIMISLQLPNIKKIGKSISHWEIMDSLRSLIKPDEFTVLKVSKTTVEFVRFEAEIEKRSKLERVISKLNNKMIKLKDFGELMRLRAAEYRSDFPNRRVWDAFFSEARDMDEMKPGERPDTVHISNLPTKWFLPYHLSNDDEATPSEKIFYRVFEKFGSIRFVDIPLSDPYRKKMKDHISGLKYSSFDKPDIFEGYVQFKDYVGFTKTMDAFRDMKLVHKDDDGDFEIDIKVEFDKTKHLSDASIRRREIVRDRLVKKAREQEEKDKKALEDKNKQAELERQRELDLKNQKEIRRKLREEKRKAKILKKLEISGSDEITEKIAREEKKLIKVQRKLEAIRIVEELFRRVKEKLQENVQLYDRVPNPSCDELMRLKNTSELAVLTQREKLHHVIKGRVMLRSILSDGHKTKDFPSSSSDSENSSSETRDKKYHKAPLQNNSHPAELMYEQPPTPWFGYHGFNDMSYQFVPPPAVYHEFPVTTEMYFPRARGRGGFLGPRPGPSRGQFPRRPRTGYGPRNRGGYRGNNQRRYAPELEEEYQKYFDKFMHEHDHRSRDRSRSKSRRRSYSRSRSRSRTRNRRSRSRSRRSRSRTYRSSSRSYSRSRSRSKDRSKRQRTRSPTPRTPKRRSRTVERSRRSDRSQDRTTSRTPKGRSRTVEGSRRSDRSEDRTTSNRRNHNNSSRSENRSVSSRSPERSRENRTLEESAVRSNRSDGSETPRRSAERPAEEDANNKTSGGKEKSNGTAGRKSLSKERSVNRSRSRSKGKSVTRSRSRSWSLPKEGEKTKRSSWSKSPESARKSSDEKN